MKRSGETEAIESAFQRALKELIDETKNVPTGEPRVVDALLSIGEDHSGDPAVFVRVVLDAATSEANWTSRRLEFIIDRFRGALGEETDRFAYISFELPDEPEGDQGP